MKSFTKFPSIKFRAFVKILPLIFLVGPVTSHADAQLITNSFEGLPGAGFFVGSGVPTNCDLSNQFASAGVTFTTANGAPYVAVIDLGEGHATTGSNGIGAVNTNADVEYDLPIIITFVQPANPSLPAVTDFVSIKNDQDVLGSGAVTMQAFGLDGALLAIATNVDDHTFTLAITNQGIHTVMLNQGNTVAYDDLVYDTPATGPSNAPTVLATIQLAAAISWASQTNHVYEVEWASRANTNQWFGLGGSVVGNGTTNTVFDLVLPGSRFYRVVTLQ